MFLPVFRKAKEQKWWWDFCSEYGWLTAETIDPESSIVPLLDEDIIDQPVFAETLAEWLKERKMQLGL